MSCQALPGTASGHRGAAVITTFEALLCARQVLCMLFFFLPRVPNGRVASFLSGPLFQELGTEREAAIHPGHSWSEGAGVRVQPVGAQTLLFVAVPFHQHSLAPNGGRQGPASALGVLLTTHSVFRPFQSQGVVSGSCLLGLTL